MRKKEIEIILSGLKSFEKPKIELEQYETPSELISEIVNELNLMNLINNKKILEVGCGTAKFSIAISFFNPEFIVAFDIDRDAIKIAKENYEKIKEKHTVSKILFLVGDVKLIKFKNIFDVTIMNPPFGIQGKIKDIDFLEFAFKNSNYIVSIHPNGKNVEFFEKISSSFGFKIIKYKKYLFPIRKMFDFHRKKVKKIETLILWFKRDF